MKKGIAIIVFGLLWCTYSSAGLLSDETIKANIEGCKKDQYSSSNNQGISKSILDKYCVCYVNKIDQNLTQNDIVELIEDKKRKEIEKVLHNWEEEGIRVEKARWGRSNILKGKTKIELPKTVDAKSLTLDVVKAIIEKNPKKKNTTKRKTRKK